MDCAGVQDVRRRRALWGCLAAVLTVGWGCGQAPASPVEIRLDAVTPQEVSYSADSIVIRAFGAFAPRLDLRLDGAEGPRLDEHFTAQVGDADVDDVRFISSNELEITFSPRTVKDTGTYPLVVTDPRGQTAMLENAVSLVAHQPTHIAIKSNPPPAPTSQWTAPIRVELEDDQGNPSHFENGTCFFLSSDSPTGRFLWWGVTSTQNSMDICLYQKDFEGFDFNYMDSQPGAWTLTIRNSDKLPEIQYKVSVGLPGEVVQVQLASAPSLSVGVGTALPLPVLAVDGTNAPARIPLLGVQVDLFVSSPLGGMGIATAPEGPFAPRLSVMLTNDDPRPTVYFMGLSASLSPVTVSGAATNLETGAVVRLEPLSVVVTPVGDPGL